ncbi:hypothetical protein AGMMS49546_37210 [Spirochaetia bacterium]|nr:hypothetical protein AGMMS49546_37210 [Spirochaetia bacterium]
MAPEELASITINVPRTGTLSNYWFKISKYDEDNDIAQQNIIRGKNSPLFPAGDYKITAGKDNYHVTAVMAVIYAVFGIPIPVPAIATQKKDFGFVTLEGGKKYIFERDKKGKFVYFGKEEDRP